MVFNGKGQCPHSVFNMILSYRTPSLSLLVSVSSTGLNECWSKLGNENLDKYYKTLMGPINIEQAVAVRVVSIWHMVRTSENQDSSTQFHEPRITWRSDERQWLVWINRVCKRNKRRCLPLLVESAEPSAKVEGFLHFAETRRWFSWEWTAAIILGVRVTENHLSIKRWVNNGKRTDLERPQYISVWFELASRNVPDAAFRTFAFRKLQVVFDVRGRLCGNYTCFEHSRKYLRISVDLQRNRRSENYYVWGWFIEVRAWV